MRTLILFLKNPDAGEPGARLHGRLGTDGARALYRAFTEDLVARFEGRPEHYFRRIEPEAGDPGARMHACFVAAHEAGSEATVLIGVNLPTLSAARVDEAFDALDSHDLVLGPARDGGYYLLGLRRPVPDLFERIPWDTYAVLAETLARAWRLELKVALLPEECAVGNGTDLAELAELAGLSIGPATARCLEELK